MIMILLHSITVDLVMFYYANVCAHVMLIIVC